MWRMWVNADAETSSVIPESRQKRSLPGGPILSAPRREFGPGSLRPCPATTARATKVVIDMLQRGNLRIPLSRNEDTPKSVSTKDVLTCAHSPVQTILGPIASSPTATNAACPLRTAYLVTRPFDDVGEQPRATSSGRCGAVRKALRDPQSTLNLSGSGHSYASRIAITLGLNSGSADGGEKGQDSESHTTLR